MKLTVLTENIAGGHFLAEHGLSYLIEIDNEKILFDAGHSDVFIRNAEKMGISLRDDVGKVVLSHGHWDHGNGLIHLSGKTLITHPSSFIKRFRKKDYSPVGLNQTFEEARLKFQMITTKKPFQVTANLYYLGEIPRLNDFEAKTTSFINENGNDDFISDDSALAVVLGKQITIITGCSHSGICNICEHAKNVTGIKSIKTVIGGFHLKENDLQTRQTIGYFKINGVRDLLPSHCTELPVLAEFIREFPIRSVKTGMVFNFK